jgi:catechol 2,3-dioxygenase-like lactoylglutathione lyase family enzyme
MVKARASSTRLRYALMGAFTVVLPAALLMNASSPSLAQSSSEHRSSSVSIRTPDFDASVKWYQDKLGFRLIATQSFVPGRTAVLERAGALIEMTEVDHDLASPPDPHTTGGVKVTPVPVISILVPDVDEEVERLSKAGVDILQTPQDDIEGTYRTAQIRDNGRHRIELREPIDDYDAFNPTGR